MKKNAILLTCLILFGLLSCKSELNCNRINFYHTFSIQLHDPDTLEKYPAESIKISIIDPTFGIDSMQIANITKSYSDISKSIHFVSFDNQIDLNSIVVIEVANHKFRYSDIEIKNVEIETQFGQSYQTCIISGAVVDGKKYDNPWKIQVNPKKIKK